MIPAVKQHFNAAADTYAHHALWQYQQSRLLWDYSASERCYGLTLDIGSGTGWITQRLQQTGIPVIALDHAHCMLTQQMASTLCADMHAIPLPDNSIDQAFCGMTLQWSADKHAALSEWRRIIRPQGPLFCSVLTTGTFASLHQAITAGSFTYPGNQFIEANSLLMNAQQAGWCIISHEIFSDTLYFQSLRDLIAHLRLTGCISHNQAGHHGLVTPRQWQRLITAYDNLRTPRGLPLEFSGLRMRLR